MEADKHLHEYLDRKWRTEFDPAGFPMEQLKDVKNKPVLIAFATVVYSSGPNTAVVTGWVDNNRVTVSGYPHAMPFDRFQCWWELPMVRYAEVKR